MMLLYISLILAGDGVKSILLTVNHTALRLILKYFIKLLYFLIKYFLAGVIISSVDGSSLLVPFFKMIDADAPRA